MVENEHAPGRTASVERGQLATVRIQSLTPTGAGISKELGRPIFIERVAPGDLVEVEIFDVRKDFAKASVLRILEPGPNRTEPPCPVFKVCGGCQWQHITYEGQLEAKTDIVKQAVEHIGMQDPAVVRDTLAAPDPLHYRNKVQFPVRNPRNSQRLLAGYFKQDSHELVNIKYCPVQPEALDSMLAFVKEACESHGVWAYDESTQKGSLRHINARYSFAEGKILITLVINMKARSEEEFKKSPLGQRLIHVAEEIMRMDKDVTGVCVNLNTTPGNKILGDTTICVAGVDYIEELLATTRDDYPEPLKQGLKFRLSSSSFFQINTAQAVGLLEVVYDQAASILAGVEKPVIIDAFAGVGTMALWLSPLAAKVIAIEEHEAAVADGRLNAQLNGVSNVEFRLGTVENVLTELKSQGIEPDLIVLDPPRKGLSPHVVSDLLDLQIPRIIYVSCNPTTLARDLKILHQGKTKEPDFHLAGYKTRQIQPVDLFPQTFHVESVTTLERQSSDGTVRDLEKA